MREEVRQAAEREAIDIVTAARRDVRRIIVEARRELLVLTAQLHAAVDTTDASELPLPTFANLLADPERVRAGSTPGDTLDLTRDVVLEARKGVRSVLDEARAEIEALSTEAPGAFAVAPTGMPVAPPFDWQGDAPADTASSASAAASPESSQAAGRDEPRVEGPVHELNLDAALSSLDFQTRDLPIPTLARLLGTDDGDRQAEPSEPEPSRAGFEPLSFDALQLAELRTLLRDAPQPFEPEDRDRGHVLSADVEPSPAAPLAFDTTPRSDFFDSLPGRVGMTEPIEERTEAEEPADSFGAPRVTPPSRLFGDEADAEAPPPARSARTFVGLFAATGALAVVGTLWWALTREGPEPLSGAAPPIANASAEATASALPAPESAATTPAATERGAPGTVALTIEVRRPSWIRAQIDGKEETGRIYQPGETRRISGARSVSIRAGDAGGVFVGVDGAAAQALGPDGRAVTRAFTAAVPVATPAVATDQGASSAAAPSAASASIVPADAPLPGRRPDARTPPSATPTTATSPAADVAPAPGGVSGARPDLVAAGQQWLDAYQRRDREAMATTGSREHHRVGRTVGRRALPCLAKQRPSRSRSGRAGTRRRQRDPDRTHDRTGGRWAGRRAHLARLAEVAAPKRPLAPGRRPHHR